MLRALLLTFTLAGGIFLFLWWFLRTPPEQVARALRRAVVLLISAVIIYLAATGRLSWFFALIGALLPFTLRLLQLLQMLPLPLLQRLLAGLQRGRSGRSASQGQQSRIRTRFFGMVLDHESGSMDGEVLEGRMQGARLSKLTLAELLSLRGECRNDDPSLTVLDAYLDRMHPDWREQAQSGTNEVPPSGSGGPMTEQEALDILGLQPGATREDIIAAHRRLMQKLHPDHGGSDYLAAQINRAKDLLLN